MAHVTTGLATGQKQLHHQQQQQQREHHAQQQREHHAKQQLHSKQGRAAAKLNLHDPAVKHVVTALSSSGKQDTNSATLGSLAFGGLLFCCGAAPCLLPWLFVVFALVCLPWRAVSFYRQKWVLYLLDFCYWVNAAVVLFLLFTPNHTGLEALVYALSDGPLAGALVAWQCPWVFGSAEHTTSVLMHLLPGLALFGHRYHTPAGLRGLQGLAGSAAAVLQGRQPDLGQVPAVQQAQPLLLWLVAAPLAFYITWQLLYFLIVQVLLRRFILAHGYETSYTCLARRAAKTNNVWNRLVRRGSTGRRICVYGALQLAFTVISCSVFLPTYFSYGLAVALQVFKVVVAVYYGSRYQCQKVPQHVFIKGLQQLEAERQQQRREQHEQQLEAHRHAAAAAVQLCTGCKASAALQRRSCAAEVAAAAAAGAGMQTPLVA